MRFGLAALVICVLLGGCSDAEDRPPGGEPFIFDYWVAGIDYVLSVDVAEGPRPSDSRDLVEWSGAVVAVEWQLGTIGAVLPPSPGQQIDLTLTDTIAVPTGSRIIVPVSELEMSDGVQRYANIAFGPDWHPLPGSLDEAVAGWEAAAAATAVSDRRGALLAVLEEKTASR